jgi:hypothetical protein
LLDTRETLRNYSMKTISLGRVSDQNQGLDAGTALLSTLSCICEGVRGKEDRETRVSVDLLGKTTISKKSKELFSGFATLDDHFPIMKQCRNNGHS